MYAIIGILVVFASVIGGFLLEKDNILVLLQAPELLLMLIAGKNGTFYQSGGAKLSESGQELLSLLAKERRRCPMHC